MIDKEEAEKCLKMSNIFVKEIEKYLKEQETKKIIKLEDIYEKLYSLMTTLFAGFPGKLFFSNSNPLLVFNNPAVFRVNQKDHCR